MFSSYILEVVITLTIKWKDKQLNVDEGAGSIAQGGAHMLSVHSHCPEFNPQNHHQPHNKELE
jgi:hypothetical protein